MSATLERLRRWIGLASEYTAAQAVVQLLGIASGLWLVNLLPVREYALYTLGLSIFTFLTVFSDLGVSNALLYFRRESRIARIAFAPYVDAAYRLRYGLVIVGACIGLGFLVVVGHHRGFGVTEIVAVGAALVAAVWVQIGSSLGVLQLRLEGQYRESYAAEIVGNAARLLGVAAMWLASAAYAWLGMLAGALGSFLTSLVARRRIAPGDQTGTATKPMAGIVQYILPTSLNAAYFSIQAPITVWLSAFFAGTQSIAEVGALGRLGAIFAVVSGFVGAVLIPRLSSITDDSHYLRRHLQSASALVAFGAALLAFAWAVPNWLLLLLGAEYSALADELLVVAAGAVLSTWGGYLVGINNARGWVRRQPAALAVFALTQLALVMVLDLSTTSGVLYFGLWSALVGLLLQAAINAIGFLHAPAVAVQR